MLTKEDLKAIEKILSPRFDVLDKRMDAMEKRMEAIEKRIDVIEKRIDAIEKRMDAIEKRIDAIEKRMDELEQRMEKIYVELDRRISSIVDTVGEMREMLESSTFVSVSNRGDIKRQENSIQEVYTMNIEVTDRLDAIEQHLNAKYDPLSRSLKDRSKIDYERKILRG